MQNLVPDKTGVNLRLMLVKELEDIFNCKKCNEQPSDVGKNE
jgi:hypothetical protein